jgi:hypothetical protein
MSETVETAEMIVNRFREAARNLDREPMPRDIWFWGPTQKLEDAISAIKNAAIERESLEGAAA